MSIYRTSFSSSFLGRSAGEKFLVFLHVGSLDISFNLEVYFHQIKIFQCLKNAPRPLAAIVNEKPSDLKLSFKLFADYSAS